jgi:hypothetical protein
VIALLVDLRGFGAVVRWTAPFPLLAIVLIWLFLPETNGKELEQSAKLE